MVHTQEHGAGGHASKLTVWTQGALAVHFTVKFDSRVFQAPACFVNEVQKISRRTVGWPFVREAETVSEWQIKVRLSVHTLFVFEN